MMINKMYNSALEYWYKKRYKNMEDEEENKRYPISKMYTSKQLKFGMRMYLLFGIGIGIFMGYLIRVTIL